MPSYNAETEHGPHSPSGTVASPKCLPTVAGLQYATMALWVQNPENYPAEVCTPGQNNINNDNNENEKY